MADKKQVIFKYGTRDQYDKVSTKDESALYFLTDTGEIYRGDVNLARGSHYEVTLSADDTSHEMAIERALGSKHAVQDDICIVKALISDVDDVQKYSYTSYVYDDGKWNAMDGNYNADNVFFDSDLTVTEKIGTVTIPSSGSAVISAKGKSLKQVFSSILAKEKTPSVTLPKVTVTPVIFDAVEVGTTVTPTWDATMSAGSYTYGPATGLVATSWEVKDNAGSALSTNSKGSFANIVVGDDTEYVITATAYYGDGAMPKTNIGNDCPDKQIKAGSVSGSAGKIVGYRSMFYGPDNHTTEIDSALIRGLHNYNGPYIEALTGDNALVITAAEVSRPTRFIIAYPHTEEERDGVVKVTITSSMNADALEFYNKLETVVNVEGANGYEAVPYTVWVYAPASISANEVHKVELA